MNQNDRSTATPRYPGVDRGQKDHAGDTSAANQSSTSSTGQNSMSGIASDAREALTETAHDTIDTAKQAAQEITEQTQEQVESVVSQTVSQTSDAIHEVKEQATTAYEAQRDRAIDMLDALADALRTTGQNLSSEPGDGIKGDGAAMSLAPYIDEAADRLSQSARFLRDKDMSGLMHDAQSLAKKQPLLFLGTMFGIGIAGARLFKGMTADDSTQMSNGSSGQPDMSDWSSSRSSATGQNDGAQRVSPDQQTAARSATGGSSSQYGAMPGSSRSADAGASSAAAERRP